MDFSLLSLFVSAIVAGAGAMIGYVGILFVIGLFE